MAYGSGPAVAALVPRFANAAGLFDHTTTPRMTDVTLWLAQISALLDVALSSYGVAVPVVDAKALPMLDGYANAQAAAVARGVNGQGRFGDRPASADEMLVAIGGDAAEWIGKWSGGLITMLPPVAEDDPRRGGRVVTAVFTYLG